MIKAGSLGVAAGRLGIEVLRRTAFRALHKPLYGYLGYAGHDNAGDEAVFTGVTRLRGDLNWTKVFLGKRQFEVTSALGMDGPRYLSSVALGGGTLISSGGTLHIVNRLLLLGQSVWACGTGVGSYGWGDEPYPDIRAWQRPLSHFRGIGVRGPLSKQLLDELGVEGVRVVGDLALSLVRDKTAQICQPPCIAVNLSVPVRASESVDMDGVIGAVVRLAKVRQEKGWRVLPLAMARRDIVPLQHLCSELNLSPRCILYTLEADSILDQIAGCTVMVGVRLHSAVLAACAGVPPILLGYRPKCLDFMSSMRLEDRNIDLLASDVRTVEARIEELSSSAALTHDLRRGLLDRARAWRHVQRNFLCEMIRSQTT